MPRGWGVSPPYGSGRGVVSWGILAGRIFTRIVHLVGGGRKCVMSPLLMEGDIRAPEVWLRVDTNDRRVSPARMPEPLPRS